MRPSPPPPPPPIGELQAALAASADGAKRAWWERYLKGQASFRGVPTPTIRSAATEWWRRNRADELTPEAQLASCLELLRCPMTEDKLAAMLLLGERLIPAGRIDWTVAEPRFAQLFDAGHLADWNAVDWFCVRVLGPLIDAAGVGCAVAVSAWVEADVLWRRRAALVGFVTLAPSGPYADLIIETAERLVHDRERFAQTGVAWVLRELGRARPDLTAVFLAEHANEMSPEARKQARGRRR